MEVVDQAAIEEVIEQLQMKKTLTGCKGRSIWPIAMKEVVEQVQWNK